MPLDQSKPVQSASLCLQCSHLQAAQNFARMQAIYSVDFDWQTADKASLLLAPMPPAAPVF